MRKTYEREFKLKVCKDIVSKSRSVKDVSEEDNISRPIVSKWVSEYRRYGNKAFSGKGKRLPDKVDFYVLEQENKRLKEENEILKKFEVFLKQRK